MNTISNTLNYLIRTGIGYRNIEHSSGITDLKDIIRYEFHVLGNTDIFEFMKDCYTHKEYNETDPNLINDTINIIREKLQVDNNCNLKGVWLTDYQNVIDKYCPEYSEKNIVKVYIHEHKMIPISDLGPDGALFATAQDIKYERCE